MIPRDLFTIAALEKKIRLLQEQFPCDIRIVPCERFFDVFHKDPPGTDERRISGTCVSGRSICVYSQASSVSIVKKWSKTYGTRRNTKEIEKELDKNRYEHTLGVMYTAGSLAMAYGYDYEKAMIAGLLHDCAKCLPTEKKISLCEKNDILISKVERENPGLLHAKAGMVLAEEAYGVKDPQILHAIKVHTTGEPDMNTLDKIIYIADYIEPLRCEAPHLSIIRQIAFSNLNQCMAEILYDTLHYLSGRKGSVDPTTQLTYQFYEPYGKDQPWKH